MKNFVRVCWGAAVVGGVMGCFQVTVGSENSLTSNDATAPPPDGRAEPLDDGGAWSARPFNPSLHQVPLRIDDACDVQPDDTCASAEEILEADISADHMNYMLRRTAGHMDSADPCIGCLPVYLLNALPTLHVSRTAERYPVAAETAPAGGRSGEQRNRYLVTSNRQLPADQACEAYALLASGVRVRPQPYCQFVVRGGFQGWISTAPINGLNTFAAEYSESAGVFGAVQAGAMNGWSGLSDGDKLTVERDARELPGMPALMYPLQGKVWYTSNRAAIYAPSNNGEEVHSHVGLSTGRTLDQPGPALVLTGSTVDSFAQATVHVRARAGAANAQTLPVHRPGSSVSSALSDLVAAPCTRPDGQPAQCAFLFSHDRRLTDDLQSSWMLNVYMWNGEFSGDTVSVNRYAVNLPARVSSPTPATSAKRVFKTQLAANGRIVALRVDYVFEGDDPAPGTNPAPSFVRQGLFILDHQGRLLAERAD